MSQPGDLSYGAYAHPKSLGPVESLDSPERVRLDLEIAGPMSRAFAYSIDYSLILLLIAFLMAVLIALLITLLMAALIAPLIALLTIVLFSTVLWSES